MPKRGGFNKNKKGGGRRGGNKKKKKDWSYYDDFNPSFDHKNKNEDIANAMHAPKKKQKMFQRQSSDEESSFTSSSSESSSSSASSSDDEDDYSKLVNNAIKSSNKYSKILRQRKLEEEGLSSLDDEEDEEDDEEEYYQYDDVNQFSSNNNDTTKDDLLESRVVDKNSLENGISDASSSSSDVDGDDNEMKSIHAMDADLSKRDLFRLRYQSIGNHSKTFFEKEYESLRNVKNKRREKNRHKFEKDNNVNSPKNVSSEIINKKVAFTIGDNKYLYHKISAEGLLRSTQQFPMETKGKESIENMLIHNFVMKPRVAKRWMEFFQSDVTNNPIKSNIDNNVYGFTKLQSIVFPTLNSYEDLFISTRFQEKKFPNEIASILSLHLINHVVKSRDIILKNNNKIRLAGIASKQRRDEQMIKHAVLQSDKANDDDDPNNSERQRKRRRLEKKSKREQAKQEKFASMIDIDPEKIPTKLIESDGDNDTKSETLGNLRDQGFTRPKVLILLPVRASVEKYVNLILKILPSTITNIKNKQKFNAEFGIPPENDVLDEQGRRKSEYTRDGRRRPEEWIEMFAKNNDDFFRLGISINRKSCVLYSDFYESDIILASPLGLRLLTGADGQLDDTKHVDSDFLSSIEILIMDQACGMLMQNWKHVQDVLSFTNAIPNGTNGTDNQKSRTDFSRVLPYYLDGMSKYLRQTIVVSSHMDVQLNAIFSKYCRNISGISKLTLAYDGEMNDVITASKHIFKRIEVNKTDLPTASHDRRFEYFKSKMFPRLRRICQGLDADEEEYLSTQKNTGTLLFIPSYFDYLRIKQLFLKEKLNPGLLCEYTEPRKITRERSYFFHGTSRILLYTERLHYYNRFRIRGIKHLIFYGPPINPNIYSEMCDLVVSGGDVSVGISNGNSSGGSNDERPQISTLFTKFDSFQIERIVGTKRYKDLIKGSDDGQDTYVFAFRDDDK